MAIAVSIGRDSSMLVRLASMATRAALADANRAAGMRAYMQGRFAFFGVPTPARRTAVKDLVAAHPQEAQALLDTAEALWRRNGVVATYVTPAGDVLAPTGRVSGGSIAPASDGGSSLLGRKRQLREQKEGGS